MAIRDFSQSLPMMLYRALDAVMPRFRRIFNQFGLTEQQWRVLRVLIDEPELALRDLAALTLIPPPSLVGVVDRLEHNGLVLRRRSDRDRRRVFVLATAKGRDLQARLSPLVAGAYAELMQSLAPREWIRLLEGLEKVSVADPGGSADSGQKR
jgi:homoprotocatechuate degradation regulator HpaR